MCNSIIPRLSARLTVLAARLVAVDDHVRYGDVTLVIEAAKAVECGDLAAKAVNFGLILDNWSSRFRNLGDTAGSDEAIRLTGLAQLWQSRLSGAIGADK